MSEIAIQIDHVSKKFCRTSAASVRYGLEDFARRLIGRPARGALRRDEFWALHDVSVAIARGECLGLIGPNGAGKSTLLKLIDGDGNPDRGEITVFGEVHSLIRLGSGLQPLLTGRENIYIKCSELGLSKRDTDRQLEGIVAFTDLAEALDRPVKHYSDGMYARLEFGIATCMPMDILLIDEVLAVGDIAFQLRCLDRINALKAQGTAIVFVSHAEMNIRAVADRCLLLFDGKPLAEGSPDALLYQYHEAVGYLNKALKPLGLVPDAPDDSEGPITIQSLRTSTEVDEPALQASPGASTDWLISYQAARGIVPSAVVLEFWNSAGILAGSMNAALVGPALIPGTGRLHVHVPFMPLAPGLYRIAGGFVSGGEFTGYRRSIAQLHVSQTGLTRYGGLAVVPAEISVIPPAPAGEAHRSAQLSH
ncbi:MAG: ABC transporter ATP-binding protein [Methylotetracoccus sp.]|nr:ABC transporter ATP-binding protein [Methylotetracoccus sp.]